MELWGIISLFDIGMILLFCTISYFLSGYFIDILKFILKFSWKNKYLENQEELDKRGNIKLKHLIITTSKSIFVLTVAKIYLDILLINNVKDSAIITLNSLNTIIITCIWILTLVLLSVNIKVYEKNIKAHKSNKLTSFNEYFRKTITLKKRRALVKKTKFSIYALANIFFIIMIIKTWNIDKIISDIIVAMDYIKATKYLKAFIVFSCFFILSKTILYISNHYINVFLKKKEKFFDEKAAKKIEFALSVIIALFGLIVSFNIVSENTNFVLLAIKSLVVMLFVFVSNSTIDLLVKMWSNSSKTNREFMETGVIIAIENFFKVLSIFIGGIFILLIWGFSAELKDVLLSISVVGVVVGFALKDTILNVINGLSMIIDKDYNPGDIIKIKTGEIGVVKKIGLRSTKIRTFSNELIIVPNTDMALNKMTNLTSPTKDLRITLKLNTEYGTDLKKLEKIVLKCINDEEHIIRHNQAELRFIKMGDYALEFDFVFYIDNYRNYYKTLSRMNKKVYGALKKNKIIIPFPIQTVKINEQNTPWLIN